MMLAMTKMLAAASCCVALARGAAHGGDDGTSSGTLARHAQKHTVERHPGGLGDGYRRPEAQEAGNLRRKRRLAVHVEAETHKDAAVVDDAMGGLWGSLFADEEELRALLEASDMMSMSMSMPINTTAPTDMPTGTPTLAPTTLSPTDVPSSVPTLSPAPTPQDCSNPGTRDNQLREMAIRISGEAAINDPSTPQARALAWITDDDPAQVDICDQSLLLLNEQRYAMAVIYYSLNGEQWDSAVDWLSGKDYCDWGTTLGTSPNTYAQVTCDSEPGNVVSLNLQDNNLSGTIPPEISVLFALENWTAFFNAIGGPMPATIGDMGALRVFDVESNAMSGDLFIPELYGATALTDLRASLNFFKGSIGTEIGALANLETLWFAENEVTGTIPSEFGLLTQMNRLIIYENKLTGSLPTEMGLMNELVRIDIEANQIGGPIPEEFYNNNKLEMVVFKNNTLIGTISSRIGELTALTELWYNYNELVGSIPPQIGNCAQLEILLLEHNNISGDIPTEMSAANLPNLNFTDLSNNNIGGTIPPGLFGGFPHPLTILYLSNNTIGGTIPPEYSTPFYLRDLYLDGNQLIGTVPDIAEGEFLNLEELLLNGNDLTGEIQPGICAIRNDTVPGGLLGSLWTDCAGTPPEIICECCTKCL